MTLTIVANIRAAPGREELVHKELLKLVVPTRQEPGCLQYDLHRDNDNPAHFLFYENWQTRELWQQYMGSGTCPPISRQPTALSTNSRSMK